MRKSEMSRREFLQKSAGTSGAMMAANTIFLKPEPIPYAWQNIAPSDKVRFGIIGDWHARVGTAGTAVTLPGVECVAACDLWDGRQALAKEIAGAKIKTTRQYQELLDDKNIDCIIAAVPDHWHKQVVVDTVGAGKDIYCEKPMSHSPAEGIAMVAAAKKSGRIVQIGSQRVSSVICAKAKEMLAQGIIGELNLVEGSLGRNDPNGAWVYPLPPGLSTGNPGLGHMAGYSAKTRVRSKALRAVALLERIWHRCRGRFTGTPGERNELYVGMERSAVAGRFVWRDSAFQ